MQVSEAQVGKGERRVGRMVVHGRDGEGKVGGRRVVVMGNHASQREGEGWQACRLGLVSPASHRAFLLLLPFLSFLSFMLGADDRERDTERQVGEGDRRGERDREEGELVYRGGQRQWQQAEGQQARAGGRHGCSGRRHTGQAASLPLPPQFVTPTTIPSSSLIKEDNTKDIYIYIR